MVNLRKLLPNVSNAKQISSIGWNWMMVSAR